jgi:serine/threonine-protein kinase
VSFATSVRPVPHTVADFASWIYALVMGVAGFSLLTWKPRPTTTRTPARELTHGRSLESTQKLGTMQRPRVGTAASAVVNVPSSSTPSAQNRVRPPLAPELLSKAAAVGQLRHPTAPNGTPVTADGSPGQRFGRYKLLNPLGEGGMSEVFTAITEGAEGFSRVFVLKRLRKELSRDKESVAQFIDEARMQASLVHGNIVPAFDFGRVGDEYFMTQEYIVGRDLCRVMTAYYDHRQDTLPPLLAYFFAFETLQALQYAHTRHGKDGQPLGLVHRDVSPGNIIVSAQGEVKLADFGIVKWNKRVSKTQAGMVKGNANFMSPEQARGQDVDGRSDLFSLGLVLYYCLTNRLPYDGDNDLDVIYKAATGPTTEFHKSLDELPSPGREILGRALSRSRTERFQTAAEFAEALAPHITGAKNEAAKLMHLLFGEALQREAA